MPSLDVVARLKLKVPFPPTNGVTSNSTQVLAVIAPLSSRAALVRDGLVDHVIPVSDQEAVVV